MSVHACRVTLQRQSYQLLRQRVRQLSAATCKPARHHHTRCTQLPAAPIHTRRHACQHRSFSSAALRDIGNGPDGGKLVEFNLADIGEGIAECELLKWYVAYC